MITAEFVRGLIRLTAQGRAQWRTSKARMKSPVMRAYLALGEYTFVLTPGGEHPRLVEQGAVVDGRVVRRPTVIEADVEVRALAVLVVDWLRGKLVEPERLGRERDVPEGWKERLLHARRVKTTAEEQRDERELWRRLGT